MSLDAIKSFYVDNKVQIIAVSSNGVIESTDNVLFNFKVGNKIENHHPFFYSLLPLLKEKNTEETFPCINLNINDKLRIVDISILNREKQLYIVLTDFTNHYEYSQPLVQEKNESVISENKLKFEKELLFAKEEFKNNFLAHLNHEIRNPLNALLGFAELLGETKLTFQQKETLGVLQKTGVHIKTLMDDLLDISKIETGSLSIKDVPFNLQSVVVSMCKHFQLKKNNPKIEITYHMASDLPAKLYGDPTRVNQILYNLLENAYRNTQKGKILLDVFLDQMISKKEASIAFKIKDSGKGISNEEAEKIFDSYIQLQIEKEKPIGQGLGLKIVKDLTTLLGGSVSVSSKLNEGSTFIVKLPFKTREGSTKRKTVPKGSGIVMNKRILAIEDDTINQMLLMKQFIDNDKGYTLAIAPDTPSALQMLENKKYLAIIIKQNYDTTTGIELMETIKSKPQFNEIPILVVSGKSMINEQKAILDAGASAFLIKPYSKSEIFKALRKL